ncbi:hypothetical protein KJ997_00470, partial [bacterium]|nr:hypothetical protein [bacterium]
MEEEISILDYLKVIYKYRLGIISLVVITLLTTTVITLRLPKTYQATTTLAVLTTVPMETEKEKGNRSEYSIETYVNLVKNLTFLQQILDKYHLDLPPLKWNIFDFEKQIKVEKISNSKLIKIKFSFNDPEKARLILQDIAERAVILNQDIIKNTTKDTNKFCQEQLQLASKKLEKAEKNLLEFNCSSNLNSISKEMELLITTKGELKTKYDRTCLEIEEKESRLKEAGFQIKDEAKIIFLKKSVAEDPSIANLMNLQKNEEIKSLQLSTETINLLYQDLRKLMVDTSIDLKGLYANKKSMENSLKINEERLSKVQSKVAQVKSKKEELERDYNLSEENLLN